MVKRYSRQREVISLNLKGRYDHPSADMVYDAVKEELPKISLGTVYRNLRELTQNGEAISFVVDGKEHFDGNARPHLHICCESCGSIRDKFQEMKEFEAYTDEEFQIENVIIHGICKDCQNK